MAELFNLSDVDLTAAGVSAFKQDPWVSPVEVPVWGVKNNRGIAAQADAFSR